MARPYELYLGLAALLLCAGTAALLIAEPFRGRESNSGVVPVTAADAGNRIRLDWNPRHTAVTRSDRAVLRVRDGSSRVEYPVDRATLQHGGLDYVHKSGDVSLNMIFFEGDKQHGEASIRVIAPAPANPATSEQSGR